MTDSLRRAPLLFGTAYYPEYQRERHDEADLELMRQAGFTVIRMGESTWSTWEPEDGRFELDWMQRTLDEAHARDIRVILGTPTYAIPMWLARTYPEITGERETGRPIGWGARQEVDHTHGAFRFHAERVIRRIVARFADHPAVIGYQIDNEPGLDLWRNHGTFEAFKDWLRVRYGTVERLNAEWGLAYWSHCLSTWDDLWRPDNNAQPQYDLAWRRFSAEKWTEFLDWQAAIVREYARADQFVTTCMALDRPGLDEFAVQGCQDVATINAYYATEDALDLSRREDGPQGWATSGVWSVFLTADRGYGARLEPFLVTETNAATIGGSAMNYPPYDGQLRQVAWALVARGARMVSYWHWNTLPYGCETYWGGVLPHDGVPGRIYEQVGQLGAEFAQLSDLVTNLSPDAAVGFVASVPSKWALSFQPHKPAPGSNPHAERNERSYAELFEPFYRGAFEAARPARLLHDRWLLSDAAPAPAELARDLPVLVVAGLYVASDELLDYLAAYAEAGGHLICGPHVAFADEEGCARAEAKPAQLTSVAGASYQEYATLTEPLPVVGEPGSGFEPPEGAALVDWFDLLLVPDGGVERLAGVEHPFFGRHPGIVSRAAGAGRVTTLAGTPNRSLARALFAWACPPGEAEWELPETVTAQRATARDGSRLHIVHNWGWTEARPAAPVALIDARTDERVPAGGEVHLAAWDVRIFQEAK